MALQFQQPYQLVNPQVRKDQQLQQFNESLQNVGRTLLQNRQQDRQNSLQQAQLSLQQAHDRREQGAYNYEYGDQAYPSAQPLDIRSPFQTSPLSGASGGDSGGTPSGAPSPSGSLQLGTNGPQPNYSLASGQDAYAPADGSSPQPIDHTSHFNAWKSMGMPATYDHPDYGGTGQGLQTANPMDRYQQIMTMPGAKRREEAMSIFKGQDSHDLVQSEIAKNMADAGSSKFYTSEQAAPMIGADSASKLSTAYGGKIPKDAVHAMLTATGQNNTNSRFNAQQSEAFGKALDPNQMRSGNMGLLQRKINSADALDSLYKQSGGNPTHQQMEELSLGVANMLSNGSLAAEGIVQGLLPKSLEGNVMAGVQWLKNEPTGAGQQAFAKNLHDTMMREKSVAQRQLRTAQLQDAGSWRSQVDPDTYNRTIASRGLTGYSLAPNGDLIEPPVQGGPVGGASSGQQFQYTATGKNGEKVGWDGQKWVPAQ